MARPLRIEYPGAFYHVMHRGNAGTEIFESEYKKRRII
jgi:putative transposase